MVGVERLPIGIHRLRAFPRLRHQHHHGLRQRIARHYEQLNGVVQAGRIGLPLIDERHELFDVVSQNGRLPDVFPSANPVVISLDGIDFAVVCDVAIRMSQGPGRKRIGRKALMHDGNGTLASRVLQIPVVASDLISQKQTFVDHGARTHRGYEILAAVFEFQ